MAKREPPGAKRYGGKIPSPYPDDLPYTMYDEARERVEEYRRMIGTQDATERFLQWRKELNHHTQRRGIHPNSEEARLFLFHMVRKAKEYGLFMITVTGRPLEHVLKTDCPYTLEFDTGSGTFFVRLGDTDPTLIDDYNLFDPPPRQMPNDKELKTMIPAIKEIETIFLQLSNKGN